MAQLLEVKVPDIGGFNDVPVIEVAVKPGDAVKAEDTLLTLESDKATMEIPAPCAGVIGQITVSIGDQGDMATWFERQGRLHIEDIDGGRVDLYPDQIDDLVKFIERIKGERDE